MRTLSLFANDRLSLERSIELSAEVRKAATKYIGRNRLGPLHMEARRSMLEKVMGIQDAVNQAARK